MWLNAPRSLMWAHNNHFALCNAKPVINPARHTTNKWFGWDWSAKRCRSHSYTPVLWFILCEPADWWEEMYARGFIYYTQGIRFGCWQPRAAQAIASGIYVYKSLRAASLWALFGACLEFVTPAHMERKRLWWATSVAQARARDLRASFLWFYSSAQKGRPETYP